MAVAAAVGPVNNRKLLRGYSRRGSLVAGSSPVSDWLTCDPRGGGSVLTFLFLYSVGFGALLLAFLSLVVFGCFVFCSFVQRPALIGGFVLAFFALARWWF